MAKRKRSKRAKKSKWCVFSGKTKKLSCHHNKAAAKKAVRARHKAGKRARLKKVAR